MSRFIIFYVFLFSCFSLEAKEIMVKGVAKEMGSRRLLKNTKIFFLPEKKVVRTNEKGEFGVSLDESKQWTVIVNLAGYKKFEEKLEIKEGRVFNIYVEKIEYNLFETTIVAKGDKRDPA